MVNTLIQAWSLFDKFYYGCTRLEYVNKQEQNIFRVKLLAYRGEDLYLSDGSVFHPNDLLVKIHLHNCLLMKEIKVFDNDVKRGLFVYRRVQNSLPDLAEFVITHPQRDKIKGLIGITCLNRGVKRLGFDVKEINNPIYRKLKSMYLNSMFILCHPTKNNGSWKKEYMAPKYLVMSKDTLINMYSPISSNN
jgi:hypothetical protein